MKKVVILGGGIAGLTAAFRRASPGETVILEAAPKPGGSIRTIREDGFTLETGPNTLRTTEAADRLLADLGLEPDALLADPRAPRWIVRKGRPRAIVPGPKGIFNSALSTAGKLRLLGELWVGRRPDSLEDESVHDFFVRRFGRDAAIHGAGPMVCGVYAGNPATLSVRSAFPHLWEAEARSGGVIRDFFGGGFSFQRTPDGRPLPRPRHRSRTLNFRRGLYHMVEALTEKLMEKAIRIETGAAAVSLEGPRPESAPGARWTVRTRDGRTLGADAVVSTLDAPALARLLGDRLPRSRALLAAVPYSPVAVVIFAFRVPPSGAPKGFGVLVPRTEGIRTLGVLYPASLFSGRAPEGWAVTTSFLGGALDPGLARAPEPELLDLALKEVARLHPRLPGPERTWLVRWPMAIPQFPLGHHLTLSTLQADLLDLDRAAGAPGSFLVASGFRDGIALGQRIERGEEIGRLL